MTPRLSLRRIQASILAAALLVVCALGAGSAVFSHKHLNRKQARLVELHRAVADAQRLQLMVAESQVAIRHWMLSSRVEDRDASVRRGEQLREEGRALAGQLEPALLARGLPPLGAALEHMLRLRDQAHALIEQDGIEAARQRVIATGGVASTQQIHAVLEEFRTAAAGDLARLDGELREGQVIGLALIGGSSLAMLLLLLGAMGMLAHRRRTAERASLATNRRGQEVATLFRMGELLQSSLSPEDIRRVVAHTAQELLPEIGGAFYVFNNSRDRLDLLIAWGNGAAAPAVQEHFAPHDCWALKRGRPHGCASGGLRCDHAADRPGCAQCVPMQARGEVYGVLQFFAPGGRPLLPPQAELGNALADGVSLALANLALREKLRNQALRDELTGLYNRRFLEETLPRLVAHAERRNAPIAVLMLDLDHFKQVNDRYGHAVGDAVLREVGALLTTRLRRMDVACRYGGEELVVLMPDCTAMDGLARAQELCGLVRGLRDKSDSVLPAVTVSIGVAAWPDHGEQIGRVIEAADAALYAAKRQGRDRAVPAEAAAPVLGVPA